VLDALVAGLLTGLSLIVAIGAQNAFVLRQGLLRRYVGPVVVVCAVSDLVLIGGGVAGIGAIVQHAPTALTVVRWLGVAFLTAYGVRSLWRARHAETLTATPVVEPRLRGALVQAFALTWLNPHVYLDTVLLVGSIANQHGPSGRWWFTAGAALASATWFVGLGYGARVLAPLFARPGTWRVLDVVIGLVMFVIAAALLLG
jgi:L-lysine exporter family protein LysE/ArgO